MRAGEKKIKQYGEKRFKKKKKHSHVGCKNSELPPYDNSGELQIGGGDACKAGEHVSTHGSIRGEGGGMQEQKILWRGGKKMWVPRERC